MAADSQQRTTLNIITTPAEIIIIPGEADLYHDLAIVTVCNTSNKDVRVDIREVLGGPVIFDVFAPATTMGSFSIPLSALIHHVIGGDWTATSVSQTIDIRVFCVYYTRA
jgi:hypothetical protein